MLDSYGIGALAVAALAAGWAAVQLGWSRVFAAGARDPDALVRRRGRSGAGCLGCGCAARNSCEEEEPR